MSDALFLTALLVFIYIEEGIHVLPRGTWFFRKSVFGKWRVDSADSFVTLRGDLRLAIGVWIPGQLCFTSQPQSFLLLPSGIVANHRGLPGSSFEKALVISWDRAVDLEWDEKKLMCGEDCIGRAVDLGTARSWKAQIKELAALPDDARATRLREHFRASLDQGLARTRFRRFRVALKSIFPLALMQFVLLMLLLPWLLATGWIVPLLGPFLVFIVLIQSCNIWCFQKLRRRYHPERKPLGFGALFGMFFSPPALARTPELFGKGVFAGIHPLAVGFELLDGADFRAMACEFYRAIEQPIDFEGDGDLRAEEEGLAMQREEVGEWLVRVGLAPASLLKPPPKEPGVAAYCPRCYTAYIRESGYCSDCQGVRLRPVSVAKAHPGRRGGWKSFPGALSGQPKCPSPALNIGDHCAGSTGSAPASARKGPSRAQDRPNCVEEPTSLSS
jgi:hypothetical protein